MRILAGMPEKGARGGPPACEPPFVRQLRDFGVDVTEELYAYAATDVSLVRRVIRVAGTARRLRRVLRHGQIDVIHLNSAFDKRAILRDTVVLAAIKGCDTRIFLKFHGSDERLLTTQHPLWRTLSRRVLNAASAIGVLSSAERANFIHAGVPEAKVFQIANVVPQRLPVNRAEFLRSCNIPADRPLLLFIGRFIEAKGILDVIRACRVLRDANHDVLLLCVGDGSARPAAEAEVANLGLSDYVRFFGYVPEEQTAGFYASATALVFPTYHCEGFPMNIFHAAAAGAPIITTRIRAAADYLKEPDNCLWVEPHNPRQLANRVAELLASRDLRETMRENNRRLAERFSSAAVTREYLEIFKQLLSCR